MRWLIALLLACLVLALFVFARAQELPANIFVQTTDPAATFSFSATINTGDYASAELIQVDAPSGDSFAEAVAGACKAATATTTWTGVLPSYFHREATFVVKAYVGASCTGVSVYATNAKVIQLVPQGSAAGGGQGS